MGFFDFFKRRKNKTEDDVCKRDNLSRVEYLMNVRHQLAEAPSQKDGLNLPQLAEKHMDEGKVYLAFSNFGRLIKYYFELAILYWGQGNIEQTESYLTKVLDAHKKMVLVAAKHELYLLRTADNKIRWPHQASEFAKIASYLLDDNEAKFINKKNDIGDILWFADTLIDYCLGDSDFDEARWLAGEDQWIKKRQPKYILEEYNVYVKSLTGQYNTAEEMLAAHEKMFKGQAKRKNLDYDLLHAYYDNELAIDFIFAAILKRIGWEGRYRHSWPNTDTVNSVPETTVEPHKFLKFIPAPKPVVDDYAGIIADTQKARRFIDHHLSNQLFEAEAYFPADRSVKVRSKVSGALRDLGWIKDPATLDLMRAYNMEDVLNGNTHLTLCDPVEGAIRMKNWTEALRNEFGLHVDFIAIAASEDKSDYLDPQGFWYVFWKKDKKIYSVERFNWSDPIAATKDARLGLTLWPSYTSFVAWWISEHLQSEFFQ